MTDETIPAGTEDEILDTDGIEADFDDASTDDLEDGQDEDHTGDVPNGGK